MVHFVEETLEMDNQIVEDIGAENLVVENMAVGNFEVGNFEVGNMVAVEDIVNMVDIVEALAFGLDID